MLQFVTNLALSHCEIETLEIGAFDGMESLLELKLESNKLNYLQGSGLFPKSLHHLQVISLILNRVYKIHHLINPGKVQFLVNSLAYG